MSAGLPHLCVIFGHVQKSIVILYVLTVDCGAMPSAL